MRSRPFPNNFALKVFFPKHPIQHDFQVMAGRRVAVQVDTAGEFEHALQFDQPVTHHGEVGHHVVLAQEFAQREHHVGHVGAATGFDFMKLPACLLAPMPGILKCGDLRVALHALGRFEQQVVVALGIERRIEINQIDRFIRNVIAQNIEVIAVVEFVHGLSKFLAHSVATRHRMRGILLA